MTGQRYSLIFDCDGVLADTERFGHLNAFNTAFDELNVPLKWSEDDYESLVRIGGGKERIAAALIDSGIVEDATPSAALVQQIHTVKTRIYREMVAAGAMPPRPGVSRLIVSALDAGWNVAVASTSAPESVFSVLESVVGPLSADIPIFAGDVVAHKKPAPDIYELAVASLAAAADRTVVVEDSAVGLHAARAAGLACIVTPSSFTFDEDFSGATAVVSTLGDPGQPTSVHSDPTGVGFSDFVDVETLTRLLELHWATSQIHEETK